MIEANLELGQLFNLHEHIPAQDPIILEIGPGYFPSVNEEGAQFFLDYPSAVYVAAELPSAVAGSKRKGVDNLVCANSHALPLSDESVDLTIMRSVFGQFTGRGDSDIEDIRTFGMLEYSRVLKPGGIILIFEENTPWYRDYIESYARDVGLDVLDTIYKFESMAQKEPNPNWEALRGMFYSDENDRHTGKSWGDKDFPKCVVLRKPNEVVYTEVEYDVVVNSHVQAAQYYRSTEDDENSHVDSKWRTLSFKIIVDEPELDQFEN